jgi:hypothetical protein
MDSPVPAFQRTAAKEASENLCMQSRQEGGGSRAAKVHGPCPAGAGTVHFCLESSPHFQFPTRSGKLGKVRAVQAGPGGCLHPNRRSLASTWPLLSLDSPTQTFELSIYIIV